MKKSIVVLIPVVIALIAQMGCVPKKQQVDLFFPPHPDEPRIAYVQIIRGLSDVKEPSFLDSILGVSTDAAFVKPYGVTAWGDKIYVTDSAINSVVVLDTKLAKLNYIRSSDDARIQTPIGIAVDDKGVIYVADADQSLALVFDANGDYKSVIGKKGEMTRPTGIAVNQKLSRVYITDTKGDAVFVYSVKGERLFSFGKSGNGDGEFHHPTNIAIDRTTDNVVVADTSNFRIQVFDKDGKFLLKFGDLGDVPGTFSRPKGIGVDSDGNIYVADAAFNNVQIFSSDGALLTSIGSMGSGPGSFTLPAGLYVDEHDRIYVVEQLNNRVQVFQYMSNKWKKDHPDEYKNYLQRSAASSKKGAGTSAPTKSE